MSIIQDTFFNLNRHKYDRDNVNNKKEVKWYDTIWMITKNIPKNFRERDDILAEANLESAHLHHSNYGFLVKLDHYNLAFASDVCPKEYQLIDVIPKDKVEEFYSDFPEEVHCIKICLIGTSEISVL